jgi:cytochrome c
MLRIVLTAAAFVAGSAGAAAESEFGVLKVAPGVEETYYNCTACHSELLVAQQGMNRERWADLMVWMREEQGMHEIPEDELNTILDYLAEHYNEDRPNFPR